MQCLYAFQKRWIIIGSKKENQEGKQTTVPLVDVEMAVKLFCVYTVYARMHLVLYLVG